MSLISLFSIQQSAKYITNHLCRLDARTFYLTFCGS